jgi:hypothetical protein
MVALRELKSMGAQASGQTYAFITSKGLASSMHNFHGVRPHLWFGHVTSVPPHLYIVFALRTRRFLFLMAQQTSLTTPMVDLSSPRDNNI